VTHHVSEIVPEIDRIVMLGEGRVLADGPKAELLTSERVSDLFGISVEVHRDGDRYWLTTRDR
jgi:iron complex transport system ATP-binding protein